MIDSYDCPICNSKYEASENEIVIENDLQIFPGRCKNCGNFAFAENVISDLKAIAKKKLPAIQHKIAKASSDGKPISFTSTEVIEKELADCELPKPTQVVNNVIQFIGENMIAGNTLETFPSNIRQIVGATNAKYLKSLIRQMREADLIQFEDSVKGIHEIIAGNIELTLKGWERFDAKN